MPGLRLLHAIERDEYEALRRRAIETCYFISADNEMAAGTRHCRRCFVDNAGLKAIRVVNFPKGDNHVSRRFCLCVNTLDSRTADSDAAEYRQYHLVNVLHDLLPSPVSLVMYRSSRAGGLYIEA